jgi:hypothetical protein
MKRIVFLVCLFMACASQAAVTMTRVVAVNDNRTITVEAHGRRSTVILNGIDISPADESEAVEYLRSQLHGAWVYAEAGEVYRSPDGLYMNAELRRHAWRYSHGMRYLGEADPGPRSRQRAVPAPARVRPRPQARPPRVRRRPRSATGG